MSVITMFDGPMITESDGRLRNEREMGLCPKPRARRKAAGAGLKTPAPGQLGWVPCKASRVKLRRSLRLRP